ncbi:hypothetical protein [Oceanicaulis sp.]|uniref:hypothetical protein n=1 Tax=Oceanicaulis sp. TaxID=1924941 RepID=UPI003F7071B9
MSDAENLDRLEALFEALRSQRPRPEKLAAWLSASTLLTREETPEVLSTTVGETYAQLRAELGWRSPTGVLRWLYAAMLNQSDVPVERFLAARAAMRGGASGFKRMSLHAGGARAALMLCIGSKEDTPVERFFEMRDALAPPWWRASAAVTDTYAAIHAARGDDPAEVQAARKAAEAVFGAHPRARGQRRDGAKLCALLGADPREAMTRFEAFDAARQAHKPLRRYAFRQRFVLWAVQGLTVEDALAINEVREALPRSVSSTGGARTALAHLVHTAGRNGAQDGALSAMDAVIAAQTAMMVSVIAATSVVTTTSASSNGSST